MVEEENTCSKGIFRRRREKENKKKNKRIRIREKLASFVEWTLMMGIVLKNSTPNA